MATQKIEQSVDLISTIPSILEEFAGPIAEWELKNRLLESGVEFSLLEFVEALNLCLERGLIGVRLWLGPESCGSLTFLFYKK